MMLVSEKSLEEQIPDCSFARRRRRVVGSRTGSKGPGLGLGDFEQETLHVEPLIAVLGHYARIIDRILYLFTRLP